VRDGKGVVGDKASAAASALKLKVWSSHTYLAAVLSNCCEDEKKKKSWEKMCSRVEKWVMWLLLWWWFIEELYFLGAWSCKPGSQNSHILRQCGRKNEHFNVCWGNRAHDVII
jgi:hypothetical protein